jgi:hypothetical protein
MVKKNNGDERVSAVRQSEYAKLRNVNKSTVSAWKRDGFLIFTPAGLVDIEASNRLLAGRPGKGRSGADRGDNVTSVGPDADADSAAARWLEAHGAPHSLSEARRRKENFLAEKHRIELDELRGAVFNRDAVEEVLAAIMSVCRQVFLSVPSRGATLLEGATTPLARQEILESLINEVLDTLQHLEISYIEDYARKRGRRPKKGNGGAAQDEAQDGPQT